MIISARLNMTVTFADLASGTDVAVGTTQGADIGAM